MSKEIIDHYLVHEARNGNHKAFDELMLKYQGKLLTVITRYTSDPSLSMDIIQDAFIKAYNNLSSYKEDAEFFTWLYRIAINTANTYLMKNKRMSVLNIDSDFDLENIDVTALNNFVNNFGPMEIIEEQELSKILFLVIDSLPFELKTALLLRELHDLSYEEIAQVLEIPVGTVRSRLFHAKQMAANKINLRLSKN